MTLHAELPHVSLRGRMTDSQSGLQTGARSLITRRVEFIVSPPGGSGTPTFVSNWGIPTDWSVDGRILAFGSNKGVVSLALWSRITHELSKSALAQKPGLRTLIGWRFPLKTVWLFNVSQNPPNTCKLQAMTHRNRVGAETAISFSTLLGQETDGRRFRFRNGKSECVTFGGADPDHCQCVHRIPV